MTESIAVIGAGAWGTALAGLLADNRHEVTLWVFEADLAERMKDSRVNDLYLPDYTLPETLGVTGDIAGALEGKDIVLMVTPSHAARPVLKGMLKHLRPGVSIISASKGIENETLLTMEQVMLDVLPVEFHSRISVLSGPSFAKEVCQKLPTAVTIASRNPDEARRMQEAFNADYFRVYTSPDVTGVELGGSVKNVIAIAAGCSDGLGFGHNTRAALITRGVAEMARLGTAMGADPRTFAGLAGMGDLVLTCTGDLSRNRTVGFKLGQGLKLREILASMNTVAEGVRTTKSVYDLSRRYGVEMPITEQVYALLYEDAEPGEVVRKLMSRDLKDEKS